MKESKLSKNKNTHDSAASEELSSLRSEIDKLDDTVWLLLEKRFSLLKKVGRIKHDSNIPILDEKREKDVLARINALPCDAEISAAISKLYELLFALSRKYQK